MTDRERLIEIIEKARAEAVNTIGSMNNGFAVWYADKLLAAGVAPVQGWIPVTERLPDEDRIVLGYFPAKKGTSSEIQATRGWCVPILATHWMPLPDAPKEEADA